jgi:hypothetical protein
MGGAALHALLRACLCQIWACLLCSDLPKQAVGFAPPPPGRSAPLAELSADDFVFYMQCILSMHPQCVEKEEQGDRTGGHLVKCYIQLGQVKKKLPDLMVRHDHLVHCLSYSRFCDSSSASVTSAEGLEVVARRCCRYECRCCLLRQATAQDCLG